MQRYFCTVYDYVDKADPSKGYQFVFYKNKKPKLICKRRKEMQESMEDAIAAELEFHRWLLN